MERPYAFAEDVAFSPPEQDVVTRSASNMLTDFAHDMAGFVEYG